MTTEKLKQYIALFGGLLSAVLLFLGSLGVDLWWFNDNTIDTFINVLLATVPFILIVYGVYKNSYILTKQAKEQEQLLKEKGLK
ncbi:phage holin [Viridibacillus sp. FSL H8-0123]|uniref:phage holin n=1 Tax=Viridibacillus sp. FSL H8-0123 TaxID=1928922 RepID=UPI00096EFE80|nr:phage holin [Viridibacillus sp. FSL H8-0123]OMC83369.1 PTS mannose transporter subunit IID [Viridibacillus sp. FSL H8-0123]